MITYAIDHLDSLWVTNKSERYSRNLFLMLRRLEVLNVEAQRVAAYFVLYTAEKIKPSESTYKMDDVFTTIHRDTQKKEKFKGPKTSKPRNYNPLDKYKTTFKGNKSFSKARR